MQHYQVKIAPDALNQIQEHFAFIHQDSAQHAERWLRELYQLAQDLQTLPHRGSLIPENHAFKNDLRQVLHHSHRLIYTIDESTRQVLIHAVRHSAKDKLSGEEF